MVLATQSSLLLVVSGQRFVRVPDCLICNTEEFRMTTKNTYLQGVCEIYFLAMNEPACIPGK